MSSSTILFNSTQKLYAVRSLSQAPIVPCNLSHVRSVSSSPYGRTHVWKRRLPTLPPPVVPQFPQRVIRSDGSTFVHWTTSPRSQIRLTRDVTNNPLWNAGVWKGADTEEEDEATGRLGRFSRRFGGDSSKNSTAADMDWMEGLGDVLEMKFESAVKDGKASKK